MEENSNPYAPPATEVAPTNPASDHLAGQLQNIQYPLTLSFKILALSNQTLLKDATGKEILYTKQKLLKFREHVEIFTDSTRSTLLAEIKANKVIDWSARYNFSEPSGAPIGSVGRKGWKSLWRANYEVFNPGDESVDFSIREESVFSRFMDGIFGQLPLIGVLSGYLFHPKYLATRSSGDEAMRMTKQPAFWEGKFTIDKLSDLSEREQLNLCLAYLMMVMLERRRG